MNTTHAHNTDKQTQIEYALSNGIKNANRPFLVFGNSDCGNYAGWKYTIIGQSVEDSMFLLSTLGGFLCNIGVSFKVGTQTLISSGHPEQSKKLMTVYVGKDTNAEFLLDDIRYFIRGYMGHSGIRINNSQHIEGAIYSRTDTDEYGVYVPAHVA